MPACHRKTTVSLKIGIHLLARRIQFSLQVTNDQVGAEIGWDRIKATAGNDARAMEAA